VRFGRNEAADQSRPHHPAGHPVERYGGRGERRAEISAPAGHRRPPAAAAREAPLSGVAPMPPSVDTAARARCRRSPSLPPLMPFRLLEPRRFGPPARDSSRRHPRLGRPATRRDRGSTDLDLQSDRRPSACCAIYLAFPLIEPPSSASAGTPSSTSTGITVLPSHLWVPTRRPITRICREVSTLLDRGATTADRRRPQRQCAQRSSPAAPASSTSISAAAGAWNTSPTSAPPGALTRSPASPRTLNVAWVQHSLTGALPPATASRSIIWSSPSPSDAAEAERAHATAAADRANELVPRRTSRRVN